MEFGQSGVYKLNIHNHNCCTIIICFFQHVSSWKAPWSAASCPREGHAEHSTLQNKAPARQDTSKTRCLGRFCVRSGISCLVSSYSPGEPWSQSTGLAAGKGRRAKLTLSRQNPGASSSSFVGEDVFLMMAKADVILKSLPINLLFSSKEEYRNLRKIYRILSV